MPRPARETWPCGLSAVHLLCPPRIHNANTVVSGEGPLLWQEIRVR